MAEKLCYANLLKSDDQEQNRLIFREGKTDPFKELSDTESRSSSRIVKFFHYDPEDRAAIETIVRPHFGNRLEIIDASGNDEVPF
jgi:hypothetical protein